MKNLYICRSDWGNPGDLWSSPLHYVDKSLQGPLVDTNSLEQLDGYTDFDNIVIGGGALFSSNKIAKQIESFLSKVTTKNLIIWGVGTGIDKDLPSVVLDRAVIIGIRDWYPGTEMEQNWLPCSSVLHPCIASHMTQEPTRDFLVVDHWKSRPILFDAAHTRMCNNPSTIEHIVKNIADHRYVLTSSYHVTYWATLLRKKVIVVSDPWQGKFDHFRHPPVLAEKFSWALLDQARSYPEAYKHCVSANKRVLKRFAEIQSPTQDVVVLDTIDDPGAPAD